VANRPSARTLRALSFAAGGMAFLAAIGAFAFGLAAVGDRNATGEAVDRVSTGERPLDPDQTEVRGTVTRVVGMQVAGPVLALPLTLNVVRGGGTKATFSGGTIGGKPASALWDGGRPLPITGAGSIDLAGPADVEVTSATTTWTLDGFARVLTKGTYAFGATVAVGTSGLATPQDGVTMAVPAMGSLATKGVVTVAVPPGQPALGGPGSLLLEGDLTLRTASGTTRGGSLRFGPGPFELTLLPRPDGGGFTISKGLLQGPTTVGG
jgi:hypothetical protein